MRLSNISFFNEGSLSTGGVTSETENKIRQKTDAQGYEIFLRNKYRKPIYDIYALFSPFNESNKAFYPFIPFLKKTLKKGDIILDVWCRTGWSTAMLAGLFPEQKIICLWEGDTDVLGYNGFSYWFGKQPANIEIYFCDLSKPLPFEDNSIAFVYALDVLHRHLESKLVEELARVTHREGMIMFPHVHLANAEPVPYFKRGGTLLHGKDYDAYLKKFNTSNRKTYVFSEPELFQKSYDPNTVIKANPNTDDYNGLVVLTNLNLDLEQELSYFNYFDYFNIEDGYLLLNPVLEINPAGAIKLRTSSLEVELLTYLNNHPVYKKEIGKTIGYSLSSQELILLYWASKCRSCAFIQSKLNISNHTFQEMIFRLQQLDILQIFPLQSSHVRLQRYFSYQEYVEEIQNNNLQHLWKRAVASYPDHIYTSDRNDNTFYTYQEFNEIVGCISFTLLEKGFKKGDRILALADINFEVMGLFWACMNLGIIFIPIGSSFEDKAWKEIVEKYSPKLIFSAFNVPLPEGRDNDLILFDTDMNTPLPGNCYFSDWLLEPRENVVYPSLDEQDIGVILHTSGSSGTPKGIQLTQGQLFQSALNMVKNYSWTGKDKYLSIGNLDSMSGLRNACIATAESGATCIIPSFTEKNNPTSLLSCIYETETTILVASPGLLNQFLSKHDVKRILTKVRCVLSTGSNLSTHLKTVFYEKTSNRIFNYYGLTETSGICIAEPLSSTQLNGNFIGFPVDCIIQIVDEKGIKVPVGGKGELQIYSYSVFHEQGLESKKDREPNWFNTGDLVKMDLKGGIELMGRKSDFIKNARSEIIYFKEVEDAMMQFSFIKDMGIISFFQDESEKMALFISVYAGFSEVTNIVAEIKQGLISKIGHNKIPSVIKLIDQIPRNPNGKLLKSELNKHL